MSEFIFNINAEEFEAKVVKASFDMPILVDFWADWCEPCKQLFPILENVVKSHQGSLKLAKVNTDQEQDLAMAFGIRSLPTVVLFKDGNMVEQFSGVQPESHINQMLEPYKVPAQTNDNAGNIGNNDNDNLAAAKELMDAGQIEQALELFENQSFAQAFFIKALIMENRFEDALKIHATIDTNEDKENNQDLATAENLIQLLKIYQNSDSESLKPAVLKVLQQQTVAGIESLLCLLQNKDSEDFESVKKSLILSFNLIEDAKLVSKLRRKMASIIF